MKGKKDAYVSPKDLSGIWEEVCNGFKPSKDITVEEGFDLLTAKIKSNVVSEAKKIWILLKILEALHEEIKIAGFCKKKFINGRDISPLTKRGAKNKEKLEEMQSYIDFLESISKALSSIFFWYMKENANKFFKRKITVDSASDYFYEYYSHYINGEPWIKDDSVRKNIITKAENFFRGFSKKNC